MDALEGDAHKRIEAINFLSSAVCLNTRLSVARSPEIDPDIQGMLKVMKDPKGILLYRAVQKGELDMYVHLQGIRVLCLMIALPGKRACREKRTWF